MISTPFKNISQNGNLPQIGVKIKNVWNRHLDFLSTSFSFSLKRYTLRDDQTNTHQKLPGRVVLSKPVPQSPTSIFRWFQVSSQLKNEPLFQKGFTKSPIVWMNTTNAPQTTVFCPLFWGAPQVSFQLKCWWKPPPKDMFFAYLKLAYILHPAFERAPSEGGKFPMELPCSMIA